MASFGQFFQIVETIPNTNSSFQVKIDKRKYPYPVVKVKYIRNSLLSSYTYNGYTLTDGDTFYIPQQVYSQAAAHFNPRLATTSWYGNITQQIGAIPLMIDFIKYFIPNYLEPIPAPHPVQQTAIIAQQPIVVPPKIEPTVSLNAQPAPPIKPIKKLSVTLTPKNLTTYYSDDGEIIVNITSGNAPYKIKLYQARNLIYEGNDRIHFTGLKHGLYTVVVEDDEKQQFYNTVAIYQPTPVLTSVDASRILDSLTNKLNIENAQRREINQAFQHAIEPELERKNLDYTKIIDKILSKLNIDDELERVYKELETKRNGTVSLPKDKRGWDAEVIDENHMMDMIVRKLMGGQLVSDTYETDPLTRKIATNTKPILRQVKRNAAGFIISEATDQEKHALDIDMQDRKYHKLSFNNVVDRNFKEINISANIDEEKAKLQDEVNKLKTQVNSYKSVNETLAATNTQLANEKADLQNSLATARKTVEDLLNRPVVEELENNVFVKDSNGVVYYLKDGKRRRSPLYSILQQMLKQRNKTESDIKLVDDNTLHRYQEGPALTSRDVWPNDTYGVLYTGNARKMLDLGYYVPKNKLDGTPLLPEDNETENLAVLDWAEYLSYRDPNYKNKPGTQGFNFVQLMTDAYSVRSWALWAYPPKGNK